MNRILALISVAVFVVCFRVACDQAGSSTTLSRFFGIIVVIAFVAGTVTLCTVPVPGRLTWSVEARP